MLDYPSFHMPPPMIGGARHTNYIENIGSDHDSLFRSEEARLIEDDDRFDMNSQFSDMGSEIDADLLTYDKISSSLGMLIYRNI
jgi:hypothetical protein